MIARAYDFSTDNIPQYWDGQPWTALLLISMVLTVLIFLVSLILLIVAAVLYVPLLCYIQGNLKEYVCHKVDKRIGEIIRKSQKKRIARNAAIEKKIEAGGQIVNAKGELVDASLLKPTLPNISLDDDKPLMSRSNSPAFNRSASNVRSASPAFGRASPAPGAYSMHPYPPSQPYPTDKHRSPDYPDSSAAYDDIFDEYADPVLPRPYEHEYNSSSTSLVAHAAPPGRAPSRAGQHAYPPPPRPQPARPSTPVRGAPDFPPTAPATPSYPPMSRGGMPHQFEAVRQQQQWGYGAPPDRRQWP